jgi:hypothetical protein
MSGSASSAPDPHVVASRWAGLHDEAGVRIAARPPGLSHGELPGRVARFTRSVEATLTVGRDHGRYAKESESGRCRWREKSSGSTGSSGGRGDRRSERGARRGLVATRREVHGPKLGVAEPIADCRRRVERAQPGDRKVDAARQGELGADVPRLRLLARRHRLQEDGEGDRVGPATGRANRRPPAARLTPPRLGEEPGRERSADLAGGRL